MSILFKHRVNWTAFSALGGSTVKYVIGEVILISIGITLAIAIYAKGIYLRQLECKTKSKNKGMDYIRLIYQDMKDDEQCQDAVINPIQEKYEYAILVMDTSNILKTVPIQQLNQ